MGTIERNKFFKNYGDIRIRTDCVAYKENKDKNKPPVECNALRALYCMKEKCAFYKPKNKGSE